MNKEAGEGAPEFESLTRDQKIGVIKLDSLAKLLRSANSKRLPVYDYSGITVMYNAKDGEIVKFHPIRGFVTTWSHQATYVEVLEKIALGYRGIDDFIRNFISNEDPLRAFAREARRIAGTLPPENQLAKAPEVARLNHEKISQKRSHPNNIHRIIEAR